MSIEQIIYLAQELFETSSWNGHDTSEEISVEVRRAVWDQLQDLVYDQYRSLTDEGNEA